MLRPIILRVLTIVCAIAAPALGWSQGGILDVYIRQGIASNHGLKEQHFLLGKNRLALKEAKRLLMPEVGFGLTYTLAAGGRDIDFPVGDLLNPVYATLNEQTGTNTFPQINNEKISFLPNNFYDARLRLQQPIINRDAHFFKKIKKEEISLKEAEIQVFKRDLVKEIKTAYYRYRQAKEAIRIYDNALALLAENLRVNESLLRNDKVIPSVLIRVKSEIVNVEAQRNQAIANAQNAAAFFNFLLNRDLEAEIEMGEGIVDADLQFAEGEINAADKREELLQLGSAQTINALVLDLKKGYKVPKVGLQVDVGSQNFDFKYGGYVLAGVSVDVPVWTANRNELQAQQAALDLKTIAEKMEDAKNRIALETRTIRNSILAEIETWRSYKAQKTSAQRQYDDTLRRYKEGVSNYLELLDARTQLTNVDLQRSLAAFNILIKKAELERATASYRLP
ncbi:MAG TPA: TolC family protein [Bacteroidetes bacterium]|nr:TolC family protein [Bacteroidota bacterium]